MAAKEKEKKKTSLKEVVGKAADVMTGATKLLPGEASEIRIERADDGSGYIAHTSHREGKNHEYRPPHKSVHKSLNSVHRHAKMAFEGPGESDDMDNEEREYETD